MGCRAGERGRGADCIFGVAGRLGLTGRVSMWEGHDRWREQWREHFD